MKNLHDSYDHNSLGFFIIRDNSISQAVGREHRIAEQMSACRQERMMHTRGHTTVWGTPIEIGRARHTKSWYQPLRDWWTVHHAVRQHATLDALQRCWDTTREAVTSYRAEAAPEMAAVHHAMSVATMLYGLSS